MLILGMLIHYFRFDSLAFDVVPTNARVSVRPQKMIEDTMANKGQPISPKTTPSAEYPMPEDKSMFLAFRTLPLPSRYAPIKSGTISGAPKIVIKKRIASTRMVN